MVFKFSRNGGLRDHYHGISCESLLSSIEFGGGSNKLDGFNFRDLGKVEADPT